MPPRKESTSLPRLAGAPNDDALWLREIVGMPEIEAGANPLTQPPAEPPAAADPTADAPADANLSAPLSPRELARMRTAAREFGKAADLFERVYYAQ